MDGDSLVHVHIHVVMASRDEVDQLLLESVVHGHHVYKTVWTMFMWEILTVGTARETGAIVLN